MTGRNTTITITRNAGRNDISVAGQSVSLAGPGLDREAGDWLKDVLFPNGQHDKPSPRRAGPGKTRKRRNRRRHKASPRPGSVGHAGAAGG